MKKISIVLTILFAINSVAVFAHHGANSSSGKIQSIFSKDYKYRINTEEAHIGHFYLKKSRASRKGNEKLKVEHTIHLENNVVKTFVIKYEEKTSLLSYVYDMQGFRYFFNFFIKDDLLNESSPGAMTIYNKATNRFTVANVTLDPLLESE